MIQFPKPYHLHRIQRNSSDLALLVAAYRAAAGRAGALRDWFAPGTQAWRRAHLARRQCQHYQQFLVRHALRQNVDLDMAVARWERVSSWYGR